MIEHFVLYLNKNFYENYPFIIRFSTLYVLVKKNQSTKMKETIKNQFEAKIDSVFNAHISENEPGAAILVSYNGEMLIGKGYGMRDTAGKHPITKTTNMRIASVSKQFTALTVLSLVENGKLSLSDSVYSFFPYPSFKDITIEQLINHTSGLADAEEAFFKEWDSTKIAENKDILEWYSRENRKVIPPGEKYQYNNGVYEFIPCLVEKISGKKFSVFAKEAVFNKAGMDNTNFFNLADPIEIDERAFCYEKNDKGKWAKMDDHHLNGLLGAGGIYTSIEDYFQYDLALRNKTIFSESTHELIFKPSAEYEINGSSRKYGIGWFVSDSAAFHTGSWFGANAYVKRYFNTPLTFLIMMNRNTLFEGDLIDIVDSLALNYVKTTADNI